MIIKFHIKRLCASIASTLGLTYSVEPGVMKEYESGLDKIATARNDLRAAKSDKVTALNTQHTRHVAEIRELRLRHHDELKSLTGSYDLAVFVNRTRLRCIKEEAGNNLLDAYNKAYPKPVVRIPTFRPTPAPADVTMRDVTEAPAPPAAVPA